MKYSILIPYRNRPSHLNIIVRRMREVFKDKDYEIIISEQDDQDDFSVACTQNVGFLKSTGDIIVLQLVDYYPTDNVDYEYKGYPTLPVKNVFFLDRDNSTLRSEEDTPPGYRHFSKGVDDNFFGGVVIMHRKDFELINGFNPLYKGWGSEDEDLRERMRYYGKYPIRLKEGTFHALYHADNGDMSRRTEKSKKNFLEGRHILRNFHEYLHHGLSSMMYTQNVNIIADDLIHIKSTNYASEVVHHSK